MLSKKLCRALCFCCVFFTSHFICAQGTGEYVDVVSTGYGTTVREATKAALRSAVESVVGTMVDATTLVENDKLIEDEILTYSAGMIAATKIIGEPKKSNDGLYTVKVKATVKKSDLKEKLKAASTVNVALDGNDLFARMTAEKEKLSNAEAIIKSVLAKHTSCVVVEEIPGENGKSPIDLDPKTGEVFVNIRARIDKVKYEQFANEVVEKIGAIIGTEKVKMKPSGDEFCLEDTIYYNYVDSDKGSLLLFVMTKIRRGEVVAFKNDGKNHSNILDAMASCADVGSVAVAVTLRDVLGEEIEEKYISLCWRRDRRFERGWDISIVGYKYGRRNPFLVVVPYFDVFWKLSHQGDPFIFYKNDQTFRVSMGKFTPEELKSVAKIEFKVGHLKDGKFTE